MARAIAFDGPWNVLRRSAALAALACALFGAALCVLDTPAGASDNYARVFLNGQSIPVNFNDGDTFRALDGQFRNSPCRLSGFNTLESYGPAHQWGDWHPYELYTIAKLATYNGRRGVWHCNTNGERDGYGRLLTECPDLAVSQIRNGYAHAMEAEDQPSPPEYLRAQQDAIRHRRGIWAHGVPDFVLTSLHSFDEDPSRSSSYNRLVSTRDGHSEKYEHHDVYGECEWVCTTETRVDEPRVRAAARRLRENRDIAPHLAEFGNAVLFELVSRYVRKNELPESVPEAARAAITAQLQEERRTGRLGGTHSAPGGCMVYAAFERRYGVDRAVCMRGHGTWHGRPGGTH